MLLNIVATEGAALSATETIATAQDEAGSLSTLVPRYLHAARAHAEARYRDAAAGVFGRHGADSLTGDPAWGAVTRRLYDAEADGWNPARLLATARDMRELGTADSIAEVMSWRIDAILTGTPEPPRPDLPYESPAAASARLGSLAAAVLGPRHAETARSEKAWPALLAALRRAEHASHDAEQLLSDAADPREPRTARGISETLARRIGHHLASAERDGKRSWEQAPRSVRAEDLPPWIPAPGTGPGLPAYLRDAAALISARVTALAERAITGHPAWMAMLGQPPADTVTHTEWLRHVAVIAAYRDQHQIVTDDPRQPLGPYPEAGRPAHHAYWHAAGSVLSARRLTGLDHAAPGRREPDPATAQLAADIYRALPEGERTAIAADIAADAGTLWLGDRRSPDEHAAAQPAYAARLTAALTARGHLSPHASGPDRDDAHHDEPVEAPYARRTPHPRTRPTAGRTPHATRSREHVQLRTPLPDPESRTPAPHR